jgi:integrase
MAVETISLKSINRLEAGQTIWDQAVKGFGVRRQRKATVYVLKYRDRTGRQRFKTIGRHGSPWTPESARNEAKLYLAALISNRTTSGQNQGKTLSFAEAADLYQTRYAVLHKKPRSLAEDRRNLARHIVPYLGHKGLMDITPETVEAFLGHRRQFPANANRCLALISHIFTSAGKWGYVPGGFNPCRGVRRYREKRRERFLSDKEISRLGAILSASGSPAIKGSARQEDWRAVNVFKLLIYTGARLSEILTLQWGYIHWDQNYARLPDSKTGAKNIPLPEPALDILRQIAELRGRDGKYVFPGKRPSAHFTGIQKPWQRLRNKAGLPDVRIHDLRHCYASMAVAGGESLYIVGNILGHRSAATTQRYAHLAMAPVLDAARRTADRLAALMQIPPHA